MHSTCMLWCYLLYILCRVKNYQCTSVRKDSDKSLGSRHPCHKHSACFPYSLRQGWVMYIKFLSSDTIVTWLARNITCYLRIWPWFFGYHPQTRVFYSLNSFCNGLQSCPYTSAQPEANTRRLWYQGQSKSRPFPLSAQFHSPPFFLPIHQHPVLSDFYCI